MGIRKLASLWPWIVGANGVLSFKPTANSTTALLVEQADGTDVFAVDTTNKVATVDTVRIHGFKPATADGNNTFVGAGAGNFTMSPGGGAASLASDNTAVGALVLVANTTGSKNSTLGGFTLIGNTTGTNNVAVGYGASYSNTIGAQNVVLGVTSLYEVTDGTYNTALGHNTGRGIVTGDYNTIIGASVTGLAADLSNTVILADGQGNIAFRWNVTTGALIGQTAAAKVGFWGATPVIQAATTAAAPAGGTGAAAGAWDTAEHRDTAIATINAMRTALINAGIMAAA